MIGWGFGMTCSPRLANSILTNHPNPVSVGRVKAAPALNIIHSASDLLPFLTSSAKTN